MRAVSTKWAEIAAGGDFQMEAKLSINDVEYTAISAPKINRSLLSTPLSVGNCTSATLSVSILTDDSIAAENPITVWARIQKEQVYSDWKEFGTFFINQRDVSYDRLITLDCYDAMLKANQDYLGPEDSENDWPKPMLSVVKEIAARIGVGVDSRTAINTGDDYVVSYPSGLTMIQVLGYIGACHGGNWIITEDNNLRLVPLGGVKVDTDDGMVDIPVVCGDLTVGATAKITGVSTSDANGNSYATGDDSGYVLTAESNPYMTQNICNNLYTTYEGFVYSPYTATKTCFDPAIELGDQIKIGDRVSSILFSTNLSLDLSYRADISAPNSEELSAEYPYLTGIKRLQTELQINYTTKEELISQIEDASEQLLESVSANYVTTQYLEANYIDAKSIEADYATITNLDAIVANIENVYITKASVNTLLADYATIENLEANYATITNLNAATARIADLEANSATISYLEANYATITQLNAANANIDALTTTAADIKSLLAGNAGVGDLQAIHLTSANVVIDDAIINDAMISDLSASKITAGDIYTNKVRIYGDENKLLSIVDNTIQISDGTVVRVQIGEDGDGDYNLYLWDANGNMLWNATGVTESGLNDGIIKDIAVADDAAIKGTKLDIESVAECLNEDGSLVIDASQVTINDTTLAAAYTTIIQTSDLMQDALQQLESEKTVADVKTYYCLTGDGGILLDESGAELLDENGDPIYDFDLETSWTTEPLTASEDQCLWVRYLVTYTDGTEEWTTPVCLTDTALREKTSILITEFEVVQGQIAAKIWQTDIEKATAELEDDINQAADALEGEITTLSDKYTTLELTVDGLTTRVGDVETTLTTKADSSTVTNLSSRVSTLEQTVDGFKTTVSDIESTLNTKADSSTVSTLSTKVSTLEQTVDGFKTTVSNLQTTVSDNYTDLSTKYSTLTQTVDGFEAKVTDLQTTISDNYTELSGKVMDLYATTSGFGVSLTSLEQTVGQLSDQTSVEDATLYYAATGAQDALTDESGKELLDENGEPLYDFTLITDWTTEPPEIGEDQYLWMRYYKRYTDSTEEWTTPVMVTDAIAREKTSTLITELEVLQGKITAKIWQTDIDQAVGVLEESASSDLNATASEIYDYVAEQIMTVNSITSTVLESYVLTTDFEETVETLQSTIEQNAESVTISIENVNEYISTVDDDLQAKYDTVSKYFTFDEDGLLISSGDTGSLSLRLDNDQIAFVKDDNVLAHWDGDYLYTGNIYVQVTEQARFGNYAWIPRSDGSLMLLKVGE